MKLASLARTIARPLTTMQSMSEAIHIHESNGVRLWIDQVGTYLLWFRNSIAVGNGFIDHSNDAKLAIMADLRTRHLEIERRVDRYRLIPMGRVRVEGQSQTTDVGLLDDTLLTLGDDVDLRFRMPSPLSTSALLTLQSDHQTQPRTDAIILFDQTCVISGSSQAHIRCPGWKQTLVFFERRGELWAKSTDPFYVQQQQVTQTPITNNMILSSDDWQLRVEV